ncbi:MAG: DMT family transporter [Desulfobacter sp.]|nr:MAG: DMT family transporter [Desulfobacter sp.]
MTGSIFALASALFWAVAVILFKKSGDGFSPLSLNIYKSLVAVVLVGLTMVILDLPFIPDVPPGHWVLLALSGFLGITLADLCFFTALNRLGAGMVAVVECLYLPSVLVFSFLILGERLGPAGILGGALVMSAILTATLGPMKTGPGKKTASTIPPRRMVSGILIGCMGMILLALGIVMIKGVLEDTNVFWATLVRVTSAALTLGVLLFFHPARKRYLDELKFSKTWYTALPASVCGNYIALLFWVAGMKYTTASRAGILNQMSTIFIFILAAVWLKEPITRYRAASICLAVAGAWLTMMN